MCGCRQRSRQGKKFKFGGGSGCFDQAENFLHYGDFTGHDGPHKHIRSGCEPKSDLDLCPAHSVGKECDSGGGIVDLRDDPVIDLSKGGHVEMRSGWVIFILHIIARGGDLKKAPAKVRLYYSFISSAGLLIYRVFGTE